MRKDKRKSREAEKIINKERKRKNRDMWKDRREEKNRQKKCRIKRQTGRRREREEIDHKILLWFKEMLFAAVIPMNLSFK